MRRLFIHCGLHKTGTTAAQQFLLGVAPVIQERGLLFPVTGRLERFGGGHHNLAWELTRDRRFDPTCGTLHELWDEIETFNGDVILSSEDFETCLADPSLFTPLVRNPRLQGRAIVLLIYLRDQISYAEAIFTENLGHGIGESCLAVMRDIVARHELAVWEWRFQFDYLRLSRLLMPLAPLAVVFRSHAALIGESVITDMLGLLLPGAQVDRDALPRSNVRLKLLDGLAAFYANRINRPLRNSDIAALILVGSIAGDHPVVLATEIRRAFAREFDADNDTFCKNMGLPPDSLALGSRLAIPSSPHYLMDRVFSLETQIAISRISSLLPESVSQPPPAENLPPMIRGIVDQMLDNWRTDDTVL